MGGTSSAIIEAEVDALIQALEGAVFEDLELAARFGA
jgi:hypothetical protein